MRGGLITAAAILGILFVVSSVDWVAQQIGWIVTPAFFIALFGFLIGFPIWLAKRS